MSGWTFLTNHARVLLLIVDDPDARMREIADAVGITERAVQRIVADLEADGYVTHERVGRRNHYGVRLDQPLRHALNSKGTVGDLVATLRAANERGAGPRRRSASARA